MQKKITGKILRKVIPGGIAFIILLIAFAYIRTWNRIELEFRIRMNPDLIQVSTYGEPPTFAIWLENRRGELENIYVTHRAYENDWEGKPEVPVALPYWFHLNETGSFSDKNGFLQTDAVTGATPRDVSFTIRVEVPRDSLFQCWIEMNLSGDYNDFYKETDPVNRTSDEYGNGQPALIYSGEINSIPGQQVVPEILGMSLTSDSTKNIIWPLEGITTADKVFRSIEIKAVRPKPYIIKFD
jgi:hypothetical protein